MKAINIKWDTDKREELEQLPTTELSIITEQLITWEK